MPVSFGAPAAGGGVGGERLGVDALGGEHAEVAGIGAETGAVFADVGVGAGALSWSAQTVATGEAGLDGGSSRQSVPAGSIGRVGLPAGSGPRWLLARSSARSYSARTVWSNSRAYRRLICAETCPSRAISACSDTPALKRGGVVMTQLVREGVPDAGLGVGAVEFSAQRVLRQAATVVGEQDLRWPAGAWVADRTTR